MLALEMLGVGEEVRPPSKAKHTLQQRFRNARASKTQPAAGAHVTPSVTYKCALVLSKHIGEGHLLVRITATMNARSTT